MTTILFDDMCEFISEYLSIDKHDLKESTRIGEDLLIVGDDAEEFLDAFSKKFNVDFSELEFNNYFPSEASSAMHCYLSKHGSKSKNKIRVLQMLDKIEEKVWGFFSGKTSFNTLTLEQMHETIKQQKWKSSI